MAHVLHMMIASTVANMWSPLPAQVDTPCYRGCPMPRSLIGSGLVPIKTDYRILLHMLRTHYMLRRDGFGRLGQLDRNGTFVPYVHTTWIRTLFSSSLHVQNIGHSNGCIGFEYRSGALIRGTFRQTVFVPEIGSIILDYKKEFNPDTTNRVVYNLPEAMFCTGVRKGDIPPLAKQSKAWRIVPFKEAYPDTPDGTPWFVRVAGKVMEFGNLRSDGEFIPEYGLPVFPYVKVAYPRVLRKGDRSIYYNLPSKFSVLPDAKEPEFEDVFELRSGRLIQGRLDKSGNFKPRIGSKVIELKDYDPIAMKRVYNLPGVWRKIN